MSIDACYLFMYANVKIKLFRRKSLGLEGWPCPAWTKWKPGGREVSGRHSGPTANLSPRHPMTWSASGCT